MRHSLLVAIPTALFTVLGGTQAPPPSTPTLGAANVERLATMVRTYFAEIDADQWAKARKSVAQLVDAAGKAAKATKVADPLLALDDWREIVRRAAAGDGPSLSAGYGRGVLKEVSIESPIDPKADAKELKEVFDLRLKALVSVPPDFAKVACPVLVALHPAEREAGRSLAKMRKSKEIDAAARAWAAATYSKELLARAIVVVPILDCVERGRDAISFSRPAWDSDEGAKWAFHALGEFVLRGVNHDARRIFIDGSGSGAAAALDFCTLFPGLQTGAVVRGALLFDAAFEVRFENAMLASILFVGRDGTVFFEKFAAAGGFALTRKETLDDAALLAWIGDHPKTIAPTRIRLRAADLDHAGSYWIQVIEADRNFENEPILVEAVADRAKNQITLFTNRKVTTIRVFLNVDLLDLFREVLILHLRFDDKGEPQEPSKR